MGSVFIGGKGRQRKFNLRKKKTTGVVRQAYEPTDSEKYNRVYIQTENKRRNGDFQQESSEEKKIKDEPGS